MEKLNLLIILSCFCFTTTYAQIDLGDNPKPIKSVMEELWGKEMVGKLMVGDDFANTRQKLEKQLKDKDDCSGVGFNAAEVLLCEPSGASVIVNFSGASPDERRAVQYAADVWSRVLNLTVPVVVDFNFSALPPGVLGSAGPDQFWNGGGVVFPDALIDQLVGFDVSAAFGNGPSDMQINFSNEFSWYHGLDGCPPDGQFDLVTVAMHEMGHGLGFLSSDFVFGAGEFPQFFGVGHPAGACVGFNFGGPAPVPYIFDTFIRSASFGGDPYSAFTAPGITPVGVQPPGFGCHFGLDAYYTSDDLTFVGPETIACFGGPAKLYAPTTYRPGSSISHYDEATYPGLDPNNLETPFYSGGFHNPGCMLATLRDMGYDTASDVAECEVVPTMGEWGLMSLGLLLLILGVVTIKSRQLVTG